MRRLTVLLVDDNPDHRFLTQRALAGLRDEVEVLVVAAADGREALARAWGDPPLAPDLVLLDIKMPGMTGFDVLRALRADPRTASLRVVMLTSSENAKDVEEARALGADDYVMKAMDPQAFREALAAAVRRHAR